MASHNKTAEQFQQDIANLYGTRDCILWDLYHTKEKKFLQDKIELLLPDDNWTDCNNEKILKKNQKLAHLRTEMSDAIWNQRKYNEGNVLASIIFVLHIPRTDRTSSVLVEKKYAIYPVFRLRKCKKENSSKNCCMIFVDEHSRVYQNWNDYVNNNKIGKGIIVTPTNGIYTLNSNDEVNLSIFLTPEASTKNEVMKVVDYTVSGVGITAAVALPATIFFPPLAVLTIPFVVIGSIAGSWGIGRSSADLADRGHHEQSIGLHNREARSSWLNIGVGVVGLGACATTGVLQAYSAAGRVIPDALQKATLGMNGLSIATGGASVGNCVSDLILKSLDGDDITSQDILALSTALFVFTHSIYNIHLTQKAIAASENQNSFQTFFKKFIGIEQNSFQRVELHKTVSCVFGKSKLLNLSLLKGDAIRLLNKIPHNRNSSEVIKCLKKILSDSEETSKKLFKSGETSKNIRQRLSSISTNTDRPLIKSETTKIEPDIMNYIISIIMDLIKNQQVVRYENMVDAILNIVQDVSELVLLKLIDMAKSFGSEILRAFSNDEKIEIPFENFLWEVYSASISVSQGFKLTVDILCRFSREIYRFINDYYNGYRSSTCRKQICQQCGGYFTITELNEI